MCVNGAVGNSVQFFWRLCWFVLLWPPSADTSIIIHIVKLHPSAHKRKQPTASYLCLSIYHSWLLRSLFWIRNMHYSKLGYITGCMHVCRTFDFSYSPSMINLCGIFDGFNMDGRMKWVSLRTRGISPFNNVCIKYGLGLAFHSVNCHKQITA